MTWKITYKEILLVVGVIVALAVAAVFWYKNASLGNSADTASLAKISNSTWMEFIEKSVPKVLLQKFR